MLYPVGKQTYKLELSRNWRIHDIFHESLIEQDITKKERMNEFSPLKFELGDKKKYEVEVIRDSVVYAKKVDEHLSGLYYLIAWKGYPKEKNT